MKKTHFVYHPSATQTACGNSVNLRKVTTLQDSITCIPCAERVGRYSNETKTVDEWARKYFDTEGRSDPDDR